ncbi:MAG: 2-dehydro-3-deoxygalactonokinase [Rhodocyclaceae bacterium]
MNDDYIAVNWGSTNLRAWRYQNGHCIDALSSEAGITRLAGKDARATFDRLIGPWLDPAGRSRVIMAGMVGSNAGWLSVPYLSCPTDLGRVSQHLTRVDEVAGAHVCIVPGVSVNRDDNANVMRGEETQLIGARNACPTTLYVMPGTHCKWVRVDGDTLVDFRTVMTGEMHHILMRHSLIGMGLPEQVSAPEVFREGLLAGFDNPSILRALFEARAAHVLGRLARDTVSEWLSGLLIGNEISSLRHIYPMAPGEHITLVGPARLTERYAHALDIAGVAHRTVNGDVAFQSGIRSIVHGLA